MYRNQQISILKEVPVIADVNARLLEIARVVEQNDDARQIMAACQKILDACNIINQLAAQPLQEEITNPVNN